ncbi:MAG TPA: hypothetical protein VLH60_02875 [Sedimentisphaerales bacterium]|nr:hypothetical protein [Sedimentisphaerales bacterium]
MELPRPCAGKPTVDAAIRYLNARTAEMLPLRASGRCVIEYYDQDGKRRRESFPAIIRTMPPQGLYFQGNLIIPKGVVLGTNSEEFWLWIRLREVDSFWSGRHAECVSANLLFAPAGILEALGYVRLDPQNAGGYSLQHKSPYDVVTMHTDSGGTAKRVWLWPCDSTVRKIEYFGADGKAVLTTLLRQYAAVQGDFQVPTQIDMTAHREDGRSEKISITLNRDTLEVFEPTERQAEALFTRPEPAGVRHIFRLGDDCRFVEEVGSR